MKNIYVGNLPYQISEEELRTTFAGYGDVASVKIIMDRVSGQSKGFGFVEMTDEGHAAEAIKNLDGTEISGRNLRVSEARPREAQPPREDRW